MDPRPPHDQPAYIPTPADIRRECEQIQKSWTPRERAKRAVEGRRPVVLPTCDDRTMHLHAAASALV